VAAKLEKEEILEFLEFLKDRLEIKEPIGSILDNYINNYATKKAKPVIKRIRYGAEMGEELATLLKKEKLISDIQRFALENSGNDPVKALNAIIDSYGQRENVTGAYIKASITFVAMFGVFLMIGLYPDLISQMITASAAGSSPEEAKKFLPFYLAEPIYLILAGGIPIALLIIVVIYYYFAKRSDPSLIYKVSKVDEYDDGLTILKTIKGLYESGIELPEIFYILSKQLPQRSFKKMCNEIYKGYEYGEPKMAFWFRKHGFGISVYERLDLIEKGGKVQENLDKAVNLLGKKHLRSVEKTRVQLPAIVSVLGYTVVGVFAIHVTAKQLDAMFGLQ
jgi:type II secretory pathway component PulF